VSADLERRIERLELARGGGSGWWSDGPPRLYWDGEGPDDGGSISLRWPEAMAGAQEGERRADEP
jgi:hypothetical protein